MRKGFKRKFEPLKILSDTQIDSIHKSTLEILEKVGCKFESKKALEILKKNGCIVDHKTKIVKIPAFLAEECLRRTPNNFLVKSRNSKNDLLIGDDVLYFYSSVGARFFDPNTRETRVPTINENNEAVIVMDELDSLDILDSYCPYFEIKEINPVMLCPVSLASRIRFTSKISRGAQATESYLWEIQLAQAAGQQLIGCMEAAPPLTYPEDAINAGMNYAKANFPIFIAAGAVMGGTAPVTIAGSTVSSNAELIAAIVFLQCIKPGIGIMVNDFVNPMNMQTGNILFNSLSVNLHQMAFNQIWGNYYKVPTVNTGSAYPNSKLIDYQSAYEKTHTAVVSALSGANVIVFHGGVSAELSYNPLVAIIDDDIANIIGKTIEGFKVNDETLAVDLIKEVGPLGTFLNKNHTRKNWQKEFYVPKIANILSYQEWIKNKKKNIIDKAKERFEEIITTHKLEKISPDLDREIDIIIKNAENYYKKKGLY